MVYGYCRISTPTQNIDRQKRSGFYLYFVKSESMGEMIYEICKNVLDNSILK